MPVDLFNLKVSFPPHTTHVDNLMRWILDSHPRGHNCVHQYL
jgi:hypothetical protein